MGDVIQNVQNDQSKQKRLYIRKETHKCQYIKVSGKNKGAECGRNCVKSYEIDDSVQYRCCLHNPMTMLRANIRGTEKYRDSRQKQIEEYQKS
jgi:hypothetical protein